MEGSDPSGAQSLVSFVSNFYDNSPVPIFFVLYIYQQNKKEIKQNEN